VSTRRVRLELSAGIGDDLLRGGMQAAGTSSALPPIREGSVLVTGCDWVSGHATTFAKQTAQKS
jgi:hypothetical protein